MTPVIALGEQKDFVSWDGILQKQPVRTLRITFWASLSGWIAGILAGNVGSILLKLIQYGPRLTWRMLMTPRLLTSEFWWAVALAIGMLPYCAFIVVPFVFQQVKKSSRLHPIPALCVGGAGGIIVFFLWLAVLTSFIGFGDRSRSHDQAALGMLTMVAFVIGATTGGAVALLTRSDREADVSTVVTNSLPSPPTWT